MGRQAKKGGEFGANGEFYKGGQFLNTVAEIPKGTAKPRKRGTGKQEIAPYTWEVAPEEGLRSLWRMLAGTYAQIDRDDRVGTIRLSPFYQFCEYQRVDVARVRELCEMWNRGERWIHEDDINL